MLGVIVMTVVLFTASGLRCKHCYTLDTTDDELRRNMPKEIPMCGSSNISVSEVECQSENCISLESVVKKPDSIIYMGLYMCDIIMNGTNAFTCSMVKKTLADQGFHNCTERRCDTDGCNVPDQVLFSVSEGTSVTLSAFFITCAILYAFNPTL